MHLKYKKFFHPDIFRCRDGNAAIEFAVLAPVFVLLLLSIIDFALMEFAQTVLDDGTAAAIRSVRFGNASSFPTTLCNNVSGYLTCSNLQYYFQQGATFSSMSSSVTTNSSGIVGAQTYSATPSPAGTSAAGADPYVIVQVGYKWKFLTGPTTTATGLSNGFWLVSTAAFENEPY